MSRYHISFIGAGNVAWHLAPALENAGHAVKEVYSRNPKTASFLVERLYDAHVKTDLDFSDSRAQVIIIAVADSAVEDIATELVIAEDTVVVHTSGSLPLNKLGYIPTENIGVLYPLQTFTKGHPVDFEHLPFCIEAENGHTKKILLELAASLSKKVLQVSSTDRQVLHLAAVFACNFTNHLLSISEKILQENRLPEDLLKPLIAETINKGLSIGASNAQTGPAKRGDMEILDKHMQMLSEREDWQEIYKVITQNIIDTYRA